RIRRIRSVDYHHRHASHLVLSRQLICMLQLSFDGRRTKRVAENFAVDAEPVEEGAPVVLRLQRNVVDVECTKYRGVHFLVDTQLFGSEKGASVQPEPRAP